MSISSGSIGCIWPAPSSSPVPNRTWSPSGLFRPERPYHWDHLRSDHRSRWALYQPALPRTSAAHPLQGRRVGQDAGVPHQPVWPAGRDHLRALQKPLAEPAPAKAGVELFFKWIKQHLRIKRFFGTSENAVKTQIWIAVSVYVLVAIVKKRLALDASLYTLLQILSVTLFEKMPIYQALAQDDPKSDTLEITNQLNLFTY